MKTNGATGRAITVVGVSLFLLAVAGLSFSLYGEALSKTKAVVLMGCTAAAAIIMAVGGYVQRIEARNQKRKRQRRR